MVQRGSPESKKPDQIGVESDESGGHRSWLFANSLGLLMLVLFLLSWLAQSLAGLTAYNSDQLAQLQDPQSWGTYITSADFWNRTLQIIAITSQAR